MGKHILVDLDGTLATYDHWRGVDHIGQPIPETVNLIKRLLSEGKEVRIFTARMADKDAIRRAWARDYIQDWCLEHLGHVLDVTNVKDFDSSALIDDRAIAVEFNTGKILGGNMELL